MSVKLSDTLLSGVYHCKIADRRHLRCLAETVSERGARISDSLVRAYSIKDREKLLLNVDRALTVADDLISSMRYLQLTGDLRKLNSMLFEPGQEKRKETRYPLPRAYRKHVQLDVDHFGSFQRASLLNFSKGGVQFQCDEPPAEGGWLNCVLTTSRSLGQGVSFRVKVKYIMEQERGFIVGGKVEEVSGGMAVDLCRSVFDFMMEMSLGSGGPSQG